LPAVSFLAVPFYHIGNLFGMPQLGAYSLNPILGIISAYLVYRVSREIGGRKWSSIGASFIYVFATNMLPYMHTLTQHALTATLLLASLHNALRQRTMINNLGFGLIFGMALLTDIPNAIMFFPVLIWILSQHFTKNENTKGKFVSIKLNIVYLALGVAPLLAVFGWYNHTITGSYFQLAQNVGRADYIDSNSPPKIATPKVDKSIYDSKLVFNTRDMLNGLYILLVSDERGMIEYQPIVLLGILGAFMLYKQRKHTTLLLVMVSVAVLNSIVYSLFGDPWGGWSFGPRYLIPTTTILCVLLGPALTSIAKKPLYLLIALGFSIFCIYMSALGTLTTTSIPPKNETYNLVTPIPYTYQYNIDLLNSGKASSLIYNLHLTEELRPIQFFHIYAAITTIVSLLLFLLMYLEARTKE
jgi:4-amino-4-deoxy-L-arabinose transferase-like glycosyltransferase